MFTVLTIRSVQQTNQTDLLQSLCKLLVRYCRQIKQTYHRYCVNYYNSIAVKSNRPIIFTVLTIGTVLQTNQTDLSYSLCELLEGYCRQIKLTYYSHCVNYQKGIVDKSNRPIIVNVLTIKRVLQTNQTDLLQSLCQLL